MKRMSFWNIEPDSWFSGVRRLLPLLNGETRSTFFDEVLTDFSKMKEELELLERQAPKELVSEYKESDGTKVRKIGPIVYGYSMTVGPDGKPVIREFGNVKRGQIYGLNADVKIDAYDNTVEVRSLEPTRKYHKLIDLPTEADVKTARSKYNNGILEITFDKKKETKPKGKQIKIE